MSEKYSHIFSPVRVGKLELKNRVMIAPMEGTEMIDWLISCKAKTDKVHDYYIERAKDGVGLIIPGMTPIRSMIRGKWLHKNPQVFREATPLINEIHRYGTKVFFQLGLFCGRNFTMPTMTAKLVDNKFLGFLAKPLINMDENMVACDDGQPNVFFPEYKCRALTTAEIEEFVEAYAQCALFCQQAGVDGVEVHAVHEGYLMDQFTLPYCNHRTDKYGGSFENRYRFAVEVIQRIKEVCGKNYPVSLRYSVTSKTIGFNVGAVPGEDFVEAGRTMMESERAIRHLRNAGVDMFNCDNGTYDAWFWSHPPVYMPLNCNLEDVKHIKQFTDAPVYCAGRMQLDTAEEAIKNGELDGVAIGRQFLADEAFLTKARQGREDEIRPCISCHSGCLPVATYKGVGVEMDPSQHSDPRMCALNCRTFAEKKYTPVPSAHPKHFAVIGGGIAGMEFALQAAKRNHTVDLYEKTDELGGAFIAAAALSFKEKDRELLDWYKRELAKSTVNVHMRSEIRNLDEIKADEIVIATGASARTLKIPGAKRSITAIDYLRKYKEVGQKVAIIGGGLTGCEIAYELALSGKEPVIVEMLDDLVKVKGVCMANSSMLRDLMRYHKVPVYLESQTKEIKESSIVIQTKNDTKEIPVDSVITSIGYESFLPFDSKKEHVHILGDASKVGNLKTAIWAANDLILELDTSFLKK